jgi:metallophosphoesterase superfamily enzyme
MLTDRLGYKSFEQCWLRGNFLHVKRRFIVMPAFNPLCGGIAANKEPIIGPFGKIVDLENAEVYLLNGTALGRIKDLK